MMKLRLSQPTHLIDLKGVPELKGIRREGSAILIGSMTTQAEIVASAELAASLPILKETSLHIADPQVRYMGTLGGNVANGDPGNDMPAVMMALDAIYRVAGASGARKFKARDLYLGPFMTALGPGEIVTEIEIPIPSDRHGYAYEKLKRKIGDYATAAAAVLMTVSGGKVASCSVALTNLGPVPAYVPDAGNAILGTSLEKSALTAAVRAAGAKMTPSTDPRGSAQFRASVGGIMLGRALAKAFERASA
jgi:carbon-monoxide dehydrogenase medium subunit